MSKTPEPLGESRTSLSTLGVYVTTKWIVGSKPLIFYSNKQSVWVIGRSREFCDIFIPDPYISKVHGQIVYGEGFWTYVNLGENKTYFSKNGGELKELPHGHSIEIKNGTVVSFLFKQPKYVLEFFPEMEEQACEIVEVTKSNKDHVLKDLGYIDTPFEFFTYAWYSLTVISFPRFAVLVIAIVVLVALWLM